VLPLTGSAGSAATFCAPEAERSDIEVVALNDLAPVETNAHLLRYDSVHGRFPAQVTVKGDIISCGRNVGAASKAAAPGADGLAK
jgi:glyceraldehyde-3-phosphate dehydrogenase/erythrose-4-phosphate dehydrogenase